MKKPLTIAALSLVAVAVVALIWNTYWQVTAPTRAVERGVRESEQRREEIRELMEKQQP